MNPRGTNLWTPRASHPLPFTLPPLAWRQSSERRSRSGIRIKEGGQFQLSYFTRRSLSSDSLWLLELPFSRYSCLSSDELYESRGYVICGSLISPGIWLRLEPFKLSGEWPRNVATYTRITAVPRHVPGLTLLLFLCACIILSVGKEIWYFS